MLENGKTMPSIDAWLREAKADSSAPACGMYLTHNGVVRATPKAEVRGVETGGVAPGHKVGGMVFDYDAEKVRSAIEATRAMPGIESVSVPSRSKKRYFLYIFFIKSPASRGRDGITVSSAGTSSRSVPRRRVPALRGPRDAPRRSAPGPVRRGCGPGGAPRRIR